MTKRFLEVMEAIVMDSPIGFGSLAITLSLGALAIIPNGPFNNAPVITTVLLITASPILLFILAAVLQMLDYIIFGDDDDDLLSK